MEPTVANLASSASQEASSNPLQCQRHQYYQFGANASRVYIFPLLPAGRCPGCDVERQSPPGTRAFSYPELFYLFEYEWQSVVATRFPCYKIEQYNEHFITVTPQPFPVPDDD